MLAGLLVAVAGLWAWMFFCRLWQESLARDCASAIAAAEAMGLGLDEPGLSNRRQARAVLNGAELRVTWAGGLFGPRSRIVWGQFRWSGPLIQDEAALQAAFTELGWIKPAS